MSNANPALSPDTPITIKIALNNGENRRFKLAFRELQANILPDKVCFTSQPKPCVQEYIHQPSMPANIQQYSTRRRPNTDEP